MARIDLSTYLADDTLDLDNIPSIKHPKGKTYKIPSLSGQDGLLLQVVEAAPDFSSDADAGDGDDPEDEATATAKASALARSMEAIEAMDKFCRDAEGNVISLERKLFGDALDQMVADGVTNNNLKKIMSAVMVQASMGTEAAQRLVLRAAGEAVARANRATRRSAAKKPAAKKSASSSGKAGSKSGRASGAKSTPRAQANTRGRNTSTTPQAQAV